MIKKIIALLVIIISITGPKKFIKEIDQKYFGSNIRNLYGYYIKKEHWNLKDINFPENDILEYSDYNFVNVAHALGARNTDKENSYEALNASVTKGFKFFEVDIFLDLDGNLNCSHDEPKLKTLCNLEDLLSKVHAIESYLIIDIKSDFNNTFNLIEKKSKSKDDPMWSRLIIQIYTPQELRHYYKSPAHKRFFNPPIISTYKSHRKITDTCKELANTGIDTIAVSTKRAKFQNKACEKFNIIIHPVQNCAEIADFKNVSGIFSNAESNSCQT